jgi:hypothetical protein
MRHTRFRGAGISWLLIGMGVLLTALGVVCASFVWPEWQRAKDLEREPQSIRLAELLEHGYGDNPHVLVTDFVWDDGYVGVAPHNGEQWTKVWIPLWRPDERGDPGQAPRRRSDRARAVFVSRKLTQEGEVARLMRSNVIEGLVSVRAWGDEGFDSLSKYELERSYPGIDFSKCIIIEDRATGETSVWEPVAAAVAVGGGGLALITTGIIILLISRYKKARLAWAKSRLTAPSGPGAARGKDDEAVQRG